MFKDRAEASRMESKQKGACVLQAPFFVAGTQADAEGGESQALPQTTPALWQVPLLGPFPGVLF